MKTVGQAAGRWEESMKKYWPQNYATGMKYYRLKQVNLGVPDPYGVIEKIQQEARHG